MPRPVRKLRVSDREILARRDELVRDGFIDVVELTGKPAQRLPGRTLGPPPGARRYPIHARRGRPRPGTMAIADALGLLTGYSRSIIQRVIKHAPRAGPVAQFATHCRSCGRPIEPGEPAPQPPPIVGPADGRRDLDAVGLVSPEPPTRRVHVDPGEACLSALVDALDGVLGMGLLDGENKALATRLQHGLNRTA